MTQPDNVEEIVLPTLKYGYRTEPLEWTELIQIIKVEKNVDKLTRNQSQQREYMSAMGNLKKEWRSVVDFVLCTKFALERRMDTKNKFWFAVPSASPSTPKTALCLNDFPYYLAEGVEHWILWKIGETCTDEDVDFAKSELRKKHGAATEFLHWVNPPHIKSLPEIDHVHILVRRDSAAE